MSKPGYCIIPGRSIACACLLAMRHPAYRWREFVAGFYAERANLSPGWQEKSSSIRTYKNESIDARHGGGVIRSSVDSCGNAAVAKGWHCSVLFTAETGRLNLQEVQR